MDFRATVLTRDQRRSAVGRSGGLAALSAGLSRVLADKHPDSNIVFSPLSIYTALALVAAGARGPTLEEILSVLGARSREELDEFVGATRDALQDRSGSGGPRFAFACGVWSDLSCPLKPGFREAVVDGAYKVEASTVDFRGDHRGACRLINKWAARATNGLIDFVLSEGSVTPDTRVVLGNAVYFKGKWEEPFSKGDTEKAPFRRLRGGAVDVPFMHNGKHQFVAVHDGFKVLKLRYKMLDAFLTPTQFSMCIFLPDADDGLRSLIDAIASRPSFLHEHMPRRKIEVRDFRVPRFKLSFHQSVVDNLKELGLQLPFSPKADLSDMTEDDHSGFRQGLNNVIHKAIIEVNEEGTEAAAATMVCINPTASATPQPWVDFVADHPFAYFIVEEETGAVVFAGHVLDPSQCS
ncbi:putative serpin-Z8 [Lolium rigidum]|uniref:putative serpin-Z8 n=1 Tax=Lolium rigidum TaxID=89674 RepID=UPI001F5E1A2F|nr:putative serpin-Z8 [Lolium rigidum]